MGSINSNPVRSLLLKAIACLAGCLVLFSSLPAYARSKATATLRIQVTVIPTVWNGIVSYRMLTQDGPVSYSLQPQASSLRQVSVESRPIPLSSVTRQSGSNTGDAVLETTTVVPK